MKLDFSDTSQFTMRVATVGSHFGVVAHFSNEGVIS
jgi:hypothetical protein